MATNVKTLIDKNGDEVLPRTNLTAVTGLQTALDAKQATLVSGTNIKTINNYSLLGSGNIEIGGTGSSNIFIATYETTTYAEITSAINAGKIIFINFEGVSIPLSGVSTGSSGEGYIFIAIKNNGSSVIHESLMISRFTCSTSSVWAYSVHTLDESFIATQGTTTYAQVLEAYNAGKIVVAKATNGNYALLSSYDSTNNIFIFQHVIPDNENSTSKIETISISQSEGWFVGSRHLNAGDVDYSSSTNYRSGTVGSTLTSISSEIDTLDNKLTSKSAESTDVGKYARIKTVTDGKVSEWEYGESSGGGTSNFNELSNRPKYNNATMTGSTEIPAVPTKTSELENDSGFLTSHQSLSAYRTSADQDVIDSGKQNTISDLDTIRSGAALGATALQSVPNTYRTSADQDVIDSGKQATLVSGTNIKTINNYSLLGSGNIEIGGSGSSNVFVATYNSTTYAEITSALQAEKLVFVNVDGVTLSISGVDSSNGYAFLTVGELAGDKRIARVICSTDSVWSMSDSSFDEVFIATYSTTTYAEITAAKNAGKLIFVNMNGIVVPLSGADSSNSYVFITIAELSSPKGITRITCSTSSVWDDSDTDTMYEIYVAYQGGTTQYSWVLDAYNDGKVVVAKASNGDYLMLSSYDSTNSRFNFQHTIIDSSVSPETIKLETISFNSSNEWTSEVRHLNAGDSDYSSSTTYRTGTVGSELASISSEIDTLDSKLTSKTASSSDVGKYAKIKTVTDGKVSEWEYGESSSTSDLFFVNYEEGGSDNTEFDDILTAYNAGKEIILKYNKGTGYGIVYGNLANYNTTANVFVFETSLGPTGSGNIDASISTCLVYKSGSTTTYSINQNVVLRYASTIPTSANQGEIILYTGTTTDAYEQGRIYKYSGFNTWSLVGEDYIINPESGSAGQVLKKSSTGTEWADEYSYTLPVAGSDTLGGIKSGTDITVDSTGNVSVNDDSHNHVISNVDGLQTALSEKLVAPTSTGTDGQFLKKSSTGTEWATITSGDNIFYISYTGTSSTSTSYDDIVTAYNAGKVLILKDLRDGNVPGLYGTLAYSFYNESSPNDAFVFTSSAYFENTTLPNQTMFTISVCKSDGETVYKTYREQVIECASSMSDVTTYVNGECILYTGSTTSTYESGRVYKRTDSGWTRVGDDYLTDESVFILKCTYSNGTITADSDDPVGDVDYAISLGKEVIARIKIAANGQYLYLAMTNAKDPEANASIPSDYVFSGIIYDDEESERYSTVLGMSDEGNFTELRSKPIENSNLKVTSWSSTTTDTHYPSEKLVKDSLDDKLDAPETEGTVGQVLKKSSTGVEWGDGSSYTLPVANATTLGGIKSGTDITVDSTGNVSVNDNSHNHVISNVEGLQTAIDAKLVAPTTAGTDGQFLKKTSTGTQWADVPSSVSIGTATCTLTSAGWSSSSQTVSVTGVTSSNIVVVTPAPASCIEYDTDKILLTAQAAGSLTFTCVTTPTVDITINVMIIEVG